MLPRTLFSRRTLWETRPNALSRALADKKAGKEPVLDLTESNPTRCGFRSLDRRWLGSLSLDDNLIYEADPRGLLRAREAVSRYYGEKGTPVDPEKIFLTASTSEAYSHLFKLLCDPGDAVAAPEPSYPLFGFLSGLSDVTLHPYKLRCPDTRESVSRWALDPESLNSLRSKDLKGVITVHPNNPTGHFTGPEDRASLNAFCQKEGAALIADEVFLDYRLGAGGQEPRSFVANEEVLTFTLSGISKILGLPQMKLSWIVVSGPEDEVQQAAQKLEVILDTFLSVNAPAQNALPRWLLSKSEIIDEIRERLFLNLSALDLLVAESPEWRLLTPEGGWCAVLKGEGVLGDEAFALRLLEDQGVFVHPGYFYDFPEDGFFVISLLPEPALFRKGVEGLLRGRRG